MMKNPLGIDSQYRHMRGGVERPRRQKWKRQRANRGFADCDVWCLDSHLLELLPSMLEHLAEHHCGHPYGKEADEWTAELKEKAEKFRKVSDLREEFETNGYKLSSEQREKAWKKIERSLNDAFKSLAKDFFQLWD